MAIQGIDVSYAQGNIDWAKVKASGVAFAMIRACYGWDDDSQIDRYFRANVQGCEAVGMPYGLYLTLCADPGRRTKGSEIFPARHRRVPAGISRCL